MWIMDTRMHFSDGTSKLIFDEPANQTGAACACLTEAEFESKSRLEELNDMALQICEDLANGTPYEWNECQHNHDSGEWLDVVFWSAGNWEHPSGAALGCAGE